MTLLLGSIVYPLSGQELEKLPTSINDATLDEISPVLSTDGHTLFFTRVGSPDFIRELLIDSVDVFISEPDNYASYLREAYSQIAGRQILHPEKSDYNQDIWVADSENGYFDRISHPGSPLNNALPNSICALTNQPNEYIVINRFPKGGGMQQGFSIVRQDREGNWTFPEPLLIDRYYTKSTGVNLTLSADSEVLILSIEQDDSFGNNDLYISYRKDDGNWSKPKHLGYPINSSRRETNPALSDDMQTLFFASDRPGSQGSDIYYSMRLDTSWTRWSEPQKLQAPVNSAYDDSQPHFNTETGYLYFTSNRDGSTDIFRLKIREAQEQEEVVVSGRIINTGSGNPIDATVFFGPEGNKLTRSFYVSADGYYRVKVPKGIQVPLHPEKAGFLGHHASVFFQPDIYYFQEHNLDLLLDPIQVDSKITLPPIYFEQSRAIILAKSYQTLDYLAGILTQNPEIYIQIEGHTDNIGLEKDLKKLSEDRAKAVRDFLIDKGIPRKRLDVYGFGAAYPINANGSEEERSANRRVEFRIIKIDD
ncbi:MAG: OmpA family protein [Saprospiraceae bacterium]|nr:OmpA family protein [Saprospiraceae bacterium]